MHRTQSKPLAAAAATCGLMTLTASVAAATIIAPPYVSAGVDINGLLSNSNNDSLYQPSPFVSQSNSLNQSRSSGSTGVGSGTASADAFGNLKVFAQASEVTSPTDFLRASMSVSAVAVRADTFTFSPGSYAVDISWSGASGGHCPGLSSCFVSVLDSLLGTSGSKLIANDYTYESGSATQNVPPPTQQQARQVWSFASTITMDLAEQLIVGVQVVGPLAADFSADFSHTGHLYIDPLTASSRYTTASGNSYQTPAVPEPAAVWSMLVGLATIGLVRRRRSA